MNYNYLPGLLTKKRYLDVQEKFADGYQAFNFSNNILKKDDVLLSTHRSYSLSKIKTISTEFRLYSDFIDNKDAMDYYLNLISEEKPTHILYVAHEHNIERDIFRNCRGELYKFGKNIGKFNYRNYFNKSNDSFLNIKNVNSYDVFIYKINYKNLKTCNNIKK